VINKLRNWYINLRSVSVSGFNENNYEYIPMQMKGPKDMETNEKTTNPLATMTVSNYLRNEIKSVSGGKLFAYVYPTCLGIREFLVAAENYGDAMSFLANLKGELAR
jgi:hypothetical protein